MLLFDDASLTDSSFADVCLSGVLDGFCIQLDIENSINIHLNKLNINNNPKIVAVSKTFNIEKILPLIEHGHKDYGENKVQEAVEKWTEIKKENSQIKHTSNTRLI